MTVKEYTRSGGAKSGAESYLLGAGLVLLLAPALGLRGTLTAVVGLFTLQVAFFPFFRLETAFFKICGTGKLLTSVPVFEIPVYNTKSKNNGRPKLRWRS